MEKIRVLFGGAFNPPTICHYGIAEELIKNYNCKVTFLPTSSIYNKNVEIIDYYYRYQMLELLVKRLGENTDISDYERNQTIYKGTYLTLKDFPEYYFLIGYDQLVNLPNWLNFESLVSECKFLVIPRLGYDISNVWNNEVMKKNYNNFIILEDFPLFDGSSTEFRKTHNHDLVIKEVYDYIETNKLYVIEVK